MARSLYERALLPYLIDFVCGTPDIRRKRAQVVPQARGRVLEVGMGTGLNLPHYVPPQLEQLVGIDPGLHRLAQKRSEQAGLSVELIDLSAEKIPKPDHSFDTVVLTFTLCSIPEPVEALREMRRVLVPDGRLLYCEHGAAPEPGVLRFQQRVTPYWRRVSGGCHLDRDIPALLQEAGFTLEEHASEYMRGPKSLSFAYWGVARP